VFHRSPPVTGSRHVTVDTADGVRPAGTYTVETDEELIEGLSFPAYRRVATVMLLPSGAGGTAWRQIAAVFVPWFGPPSETSASIFASPPRLRA